MSNPITEEELRRAIDIAVAESINTHSQQGQLSEDDYAQYLKDIKAGLLGLITQYANQREVATVTNFIDTLEAYNDEVWTRDDAGLALSVDEYKKLLVEGQPGGRSEQ